MHFTLPLTLPILTLLPTLALTASTCQTYFEMSTLLDACCDVLHSRNHAPCPEPVFVANATECTVDAYPEGFACCIEKGDKEQPDWEWSCSPSGAFDEAPPEDPDVDGLAVRGAMGMWAYGGRRMEDLVDMWKKK